MKNADPIDELMEIALYLIYWSMIFGISIFVYEIIFKPLFAN